MDVNGEYGALSRSYSDSLRKGDLSSAADRLYDMAAILDKEGDAVDALKALMIAFHINLSGSDAATFISENKMLLAKKEAMMSGLEKHEIDELYLGTVRRDTTPEHILNVSDSLYIFNLYLAGRENEAKSILANICR